MIITGLFGKVDKSILVSSNYSLKISNLNTNNKDWFKKILKSELEDFYSWEKAHAISFPHLPYYEMKDLLMSDYYRGFFNNKQHDTDEACRKSICNYILSLECKERVADTRLHLRNEYVYNPSCEKSIEERFIQFHNFCEKQNNGIGKSSNWSIIYNSHDLMQYTNKSRIISHMYWNVSNYDIYWESSNNMHVSHELEYSLKVKSLCDFGNKIDKYINSEEDFFTIDYILELISSVECYGASWLIKMTSLLEFVLVRPNAKSIRSELREKLPQFISTEIADKDHWISLCYDIRSKLAHGDYFELRKKIREYALTYMKEYDFDFFEHNEVSCIISNIGWQLSKIVAEVINTMLDDKEKIINLKSK